MSRAHIYRSIRDSEGNLRPTAQVTIRNAGTETLLAQPLYASPSGPSTLANPFTATLGVVDFYLDNPADILVVFEVDDRVTQVDHITVLPPPGELVQTEFPVRISNTAAIGQVLQPTAVEGVFEWRDIPALTGEAVEHHHDGDGVNSTALGSGAAALGADSVALGADALAQGDRTVASGSGAIASGADSVAIGTNARAVVGAVAIGVDAGTTATTATHWVAIGDNAKATGQDSVAVGPNTQSSGTESVAVGDGAVASGPYAIALGSGAMATAENAVAFGTGAMATHANSTAVGAGAETTGTNQMVLGASGHTVVVPGRLNATGGECRIAGPDGRVGFFGTTPSTKPIVAGSRGGNVALASLLDALDALGLVQDETVA